MTLGHNNQSTAILLDLMRNGSKIAQGTDSNFPCTSLLAFGNQVASTFNYSYQHVDETTLSDLSDITYSYQFATSGQGTAKVNQRGNGTDLTSTANLIVCEVSGPLST